MGSNWHVEDMKIELDEAPIEEGNEPVPSQFGKKPSAFCLLDTLKDRLLNNIRTCEDIIVKLKEGEGYSDEDELEIDRLELAIDRLMAEVKEASRKKGIHGENVAECAKIQMTAEDLLLSLKRKLKSSKSNLEEQHPRSNTNTTTRLPKLNATTFDGDYLKWYAFWDSFKSTIGNRSDLSQVDKLSYLVDLLKGNALETIQNLEKTDANYKVAVDILTERFGKPDMIIEAHYDALNDMKPASNDTKECRRAINQIEGHLRVLKSLGEDISHNMFRSTIKRKFPKEMKGDLWLRLKPKGYTVDSLRETLEEIISANEEEMKQTGNKQTPEKNFTIETLLSTVPPRNNSNLQRFPNRKRPFQNMDQARSQTFQRPFYNSGQGRFQQASPAGGTNGGPPNKLQRLDNPNPNGRPGPSRGCVFCQGNHFHEDCQKYATVNDRKVALKEKCFICLRPNHQSPECPVRSIKICAHCKGTGHNRCLCVERGQKPNEITTAFSKSHGDTILQTALIMAANENCDHVMTARILFDTGSQKSYVTAALADTLHLKTIEESCLTVYTFGQLEPKTIPSRLVLVHLKTPKEEEIEIPAYVVPNITGLIPAFPQIKGEIKLTYPGLQVADDSDTDSQADILIGNDHYHSLITGTHKRIADKLYLVQSKIGWILSGSTSRGEELDELLVLTFVQGGLGACMGQQFTLPDPPLQEDNIKDIWELETIGIKDSPKLLDQDEIIKFFNDTTVFENNRYQVKWPWTEYPIDLPINYGMAFGRLTGLVKRSDMATLQLYDSVLQDQLSRGIIETVQEKRLPTKHAVHYLPHHCVIQNNKTTKLRVVYDASAKAKGHCSLNEYLYKGPLMLEDLLSLLLRFRTNPIGVTADIEKAFLQVGLQPDDRDVTRFLWMKDITKPVSEENIVHLRFCRVPFGVISSPYLLAATIKHHLGRKHCDEADKISNSLYVDNLVTGVNSATDGFSLYQTAVSSFNELSMNLRDWTTNSGELRQQIPERHKTEENCISTVLGLKWDTNRDILRLAVDPGIFSKSVTSKREILRMVASIFDPCGFIAPLLLPSRILLQHLWMKKYKWDTPLDETELCNWMRCIQPLQYIKEFEIPRYYHHHHLQNESPDKEESKIQLHCFTDASQEAYSAVIYVRRVTESTTTVSIVMSRTRLCPVKDRERMTIPKLELLGVTIGARLLDYAKQNLQIAVDQTYLWTDSQVVLGWMKTEKLLTPFVSRRISEIKSFPSIQFRFVSSTENPADIATREQFNPLPLLWVMGPQFLGKSEEFWPSEYEWQGVSEAVSQNESAEEVMYENTSTFVTQVLEEQEPNDSEGDNEERIDQESKIPQDNAEDPVLQSQLTAIRQLQLEHFPKEVQGHGTHLTNSLGLFRDEQGILRCKGRLQNAMLPFDQKFPILLPKTAAFTSELILKLHEDNKHVGTSHTLSLLRKRFWVPQGRAQVNQALKRCKICLKYGGGPYKLPPMPPLPPERVKLCHPFLYTGLDYLGPLTVIQDSVPEKRWCCIFTCMASRAVRLEVVKNLSADEFLLCLRRFVASQNIPALIVSDNAAQFKLAAEVLHSSVCKDNNIAWHFIPELSPWHGGFYERLVGMVKHCLRRSLDKILLNDSQLVTVLKEIETVLNSRPLTTVGSELEHVLSPADFLSTCGTHPLPHLNDTNPTNITATRANLIEGWKKGQRALEEFKTIFQDQYLTSLRERALTPHAQPRVLTKQKPRVGDVVQLWDEKQKTSSRAHWKVGKIKTLLHSRDGSVRTAQVELDSGVTLNRSIAHLYPLELSDDMPQEELSTHPVAPSTSKENAIVNQNQCDPNQEKVTQNTPTVSLAPALEITEELPQPQELPIFSPDPDNNSLQSAQPSSTLPEDLSRRQRHSAKSARELIRRWTQALLSHSLPASSYNQS